MDYYNQKAQFLVNKAFFRSFSWTGSFQHSASTSHSLSEGSKRQKRALEQMFEFHQGLIAVSGGSAAHLQKKLNKKSSNLLHLRHGEGDTNGRTVEGKSGTGNGRSPSQSGIFKPSVSKRSCRLQQTQTGESVGAKRPKPAACFKFHSSFSSNVSTN